MRCKCNTSSFHGRLNNVNTTKIKDYIQNHNRNGSTRSPNIRKHSLSQFGLHMIFFRCHWTSDQINERISHYEIRAGVIWRKTHVQQEVGMEVLICVLNYVADDFYCIMVSEETHNGWWLFCLLKLIRFFPLLILKFH